MSAKSIIVESAAERKFRKLPIKIHRRIIQALDVIQKNPISGEKLRGELKSYYKYRMGNYRIVYTFDKKESTVVIVKIEHRQGVYR